MEESEIVWIASVALGKNLDYETLKYSDYLYGKEDFIDEVWLVVLDAQEQGMEWFRAQYHNYKLY